MSNVIEQAEIISRALTEHKQIAKAVSELYQIREGRTSRTLAYLNLDHHTVNRAIDTAGKDTDESYTKLTYEVNKGTRND